MRKILFATIIMTLLLSVTTLSYASSSVHNVTSNNPLFLTDGQTANSYSSLTGNGTISWQDGTRNGFFDFTVTVKDTGSTYQFTMVSISNSTGDSVEGLWDIKKDGKLVATGIVGKLYGLNQTVGNYFKFYGGTTQNNNMIWHVSGYITDRLDY